MARFKAPRESEEPQEVCGCDACGLEINKDDELIVVNEGEYIIHNEPDCEEMLDLHPDEDDYNKMTGKEALEGGYIS